MMTKNQFCKMLIRNFEKTEGHKATESDIVCSSSLGVAMDHLGMIKNRDDSDYVSSRGGICYVYWDEEKQGTAILTTRELLDFLPDECDIEIA